MENRNNENKTNTITAKNIYAKSTKVKRQVLPLGGKRIKIESKEDEKTSLKQKHNHQLTVCLSKRSP